MKNKRNAANILLVEDSPSLAAVYKTYLDACEYQVEIVQNGAEALGALRHREADLVLLDLMLPDMPGMEVLTQIHQQEMSCSVIIITAHGTVDLAIEAMRLGAEDFINKPFDAARLQVTVSNALEKRNLNRIVTHLQNTFERDRFHNFIGSSLSMQAVYRIIESAAPSKATIFITGESGTGKEICAEAIHSESPRCDHQFVALNCAAIPRELMESEIFGHVKGAFTGAVGNREGAAARADGGTLFLDEICEMDLDLQSKLLRFIQTGRFQRVGQSHEEGVDIRIICATNRDPLEEVRTGRFREDLYYRLNVIPLQLPPLRERSDDILLIANDMLRKMAPEENKKFEKFSGPVARMLTDYHWPGNVRELENVIRNMVVLNDGKEVGEDMLPLHIRNLDSSTLPSPPDSRELRDSEAPPNREEAGSQILRGVEQVRPLWMEEKIIIERAIELCGGNIPRAAALLDISASTIYRKRAGWEQSSGEQKKENR